MRDPFGWPRGPFPARLGGPTLDLDFTTGVMPAGVSFTRAGTATYFDAEGVLRTAAADVPRFDYDPVLGALRGLLIEESRTNLLDYSEEFDRSVNWPSTGLSVSANAALSPRADLTADTILEDTSTGFHRTLKGVSVAAGTTYTLSMFVKANGRNRLNLHLGGTVMTFTLVEFDLATASVTSGSGQIKDVGGGWYRVSAQAPATGTGSGTFGVEILDASGNRQYTGDGTSGLYVWGAQLEAGAFPTSYIPTTTAAATRAADSCVMTGADFSRWFNPLEGTIVAEFSTITNGLSATGAAAYPRLFAFESSASENMHVFVSGAGGSPIAFVVTDGGAGQAQLPIYGNTLGTGAVFRSASAYKTNDFAHSLNGLAPATDTSGTLPVCDRLSIGNTMGVGQISGHIRSVSGWPTRLSNARLQELSA